MSELEAAYMNLCLLRFDFALMSIHSIFVLYKAVWIENTCERHTQEKRSMADLIVGLLWICTANWLKHFLSLLCFLIFLYSAVCDNFWVVRSCCVIMYPHRFNPSHARPHRDRSPRPWTSHCDSWDRKDSHRERERPVHHKYSTEGNSRRRDYSTSPKRPYRKDSSDADRSRRSPMRRRDSFEGDGSRHSLNHGSESGESDYRSRHVSEGKKRRWLSDRSDVCGTQDLEEFQGKDLSHKKRSPDYRPRHHHREVNDHHSRDGDSQASSTRNKGREGHKSGYCSSQQKLSEDHSSKVSLQYDVCFWHLH